MSEHVTYFSQRCHKFLNGESNIFQHITTCHIKSLYKARTYFTLIKKSETCCDVLKYSQFTTKKVVICL